MSRNTLTLISLVMIAQALLFAGGREISVMTKSGDRFVGELLSVRTGELLLSPVKDIEEEELERNPGEIIRIPSSSIDSVWAEGHSNTFKGMGTGFLIGAGTGAVIGFAGGNDRPGFMSFSAGEKAAIVGLGLGGTGLIIGTVVGALSRSDEINMPHREFDSLVWLKPDARYPDVEPSFLNSLK